MRHVAKATALFSKLRGRNWSQHEPNTITDGHNDDQPGQSFTEGRHPKSQGMTSDYDWTKHPFKYHWNSLALRGPEPNKNAKRKILAVGNSLTLGCGVPVEESYIYKTAKHFDADYINLSDNFVLTDTLYSIKKLIQWYKPTLIYINEFRFIDNATFVAWHILNTNKQQTGKSELKDLLVEGMFNTISMYEDMLRFYAPNIPIVWDINVNEKNARQSVLADNFANQAILDKLSFPTYTFTNKEIILDLGRDGKHPGIKGHTWMAERLTKILGEYVE